MSFNIALSNYNDIVYVKDITHPSVPAFTPEYLPLQTSIRNFIEEYFLNDSPTCHITSLYLNDPSKKATIICESHPDVLCSDTDAPSYISRSKRFFEISNKELYTTIERNIILAKRLKELEADAEYVWTVVRTHLKTVSSPCPPCPPSIMIDYQMTKLNMNLHLLDSVMRIDQNWLLDIQDLPTNWNVLSYGEKMDILSHLTNIPAMDAIEAQMYIKLLADPVKWHWCRLGVLAHEMAHYIGCNVPNYVQNNPSLMTLWSSNTLTRWAELAADQFAASLGEIFRQGLLHYFQCYNESYPSEVMNIDLQAETDTHPTFAKRIDAISNINTIT